MQQRPAASIQVPIGFVGLEGEGHCLVAAEPPTELSVGFWEVPRCPKIINRMIDRLSSYDDGHIWRWMYFEKFRIL
jgi:hypothetical protein